MKTLYRLEFRRRGCRKWVVYSSKLYTRKQAVDLVKTVDNESCSQIDTYFRFVGFQSVTVEVIKCP